MDEKKWEKKYLKVQLRDNQFTADYQIHIKTVLKRNQILILFLTCRIFTRQSPKEPSNLRNFLKAQFSYELDSRELQIYVSRRGKLLLRLGLESAGAIFRRYPDEKNGNPTQLLTFSAFSSPGFLCKIQKSRTSSSLSASIEALRRNSDR